MDPICKLEGLGCKAGNKYILKDIDWEVQKGQHWVVVKHHRRLYGTYPWRPGDFRAALQ